MSGAGKSTLNPDAQPFVPTAIQQIEDFSPEWWELIKSSSSFSDHWFRQYQELEKLDAIEDDNDMMNLLPDSFDLDVANEVFGHELQPDESVNDQPLEDEGDSDSSTPKKDKLKSEVEQDAEMLPKNLSLKPPKNGVSYAMEQAKYTEKPAQSISPKPSPHPLIQQPQ